MGIKTFLYENGISEFRRWWHGFLVVRMSVDGMKGILEG